MTLLSDVEIRRHLDNGSIKISPFSEAQLNNASYDLTLGPWVARYRKCPPQPQPLRLWEFDGSELFEIFDGSGDGGFVIGSGERVLAHTREAAGGTSVNGLAVNSSLHSTSTAQRLGISVCLDAGWGDVGFVQKWCLELNNHSPYAIFLPVGAVICQIVFHEVTPPSSMYGDIGSYFAEGEWRPEMMMPKRMKVRNGA